MTTTNHTISLEKYTENWICFYAEQLGMDAANEAKNLLADKAKKADAVSKFKKFAEAFCENKNIMNKGTYEFISFDGSTFTYSITK